MKLTGQATLFVNEKERIINEVDNTKEVFKSFSITIAQKQENGKYLNKPLDVRFDKTNFPEEKIAKLVKEFSYKIDIQDAFLSVRSYVDKEGKEVRAFYLQVKEATIVSKCPIIRPDVRTITEDLPF